MVWWVKYMVRWSQNVIGKISWCHFDFPLINREYWALWEERTLRRQKHSSEDYSDYLGYIPWLRQTWTGTTYLTSRPRSTARVWLSNSGGEIPVTVSTKTCHLETWSSKRRISRLLPRPATPSSCSSKSSLLSYSSESCIYSSGKRKKRFFQRNYIYLLYFLINWQRLTCCSASAKSLTGPFLLRGGTDWSGSRWYCFNSCQCAKSDLADRAGKNICGLSFRHCSKVCSVGFELDLIVPKSSSSALL